MILQIVRVFAVVFLLGSAAAIATPKGRLPLALRGLYRTLGRKPNEHEEGRVSPLKKLLALVLIITAVLLAIYPF